MESSDKTFSAEVITPDGVRRQFTATMVTYPCSDGQVGILAGRAPLISDVGFGRMTVHEAGGAQKTFWVSGGFAQVISSGLTILADECLRPGEIDPEAAWDEIQDARKRTWQTDEQRARRDRALDAARAKFRLAQKHRAALRAGARESMDRE